MLKTALNDFHHQQGARLVDFAGWEMPVMYTGIRDEHLFTREHCTFFDVSHMGRLEIVGAEAEAFLQRICTRNVGMKVGQSRYGHICREDGGILDDVIVSRLETHFLVVCNASNREKIVAWLDRHRAGTGVELRDRTLETGMLAIQGPEALETIDQVLPMPIGELKRYHCKSGSLFGASYVVARSGYTGEDGLEIILPAAFAATAISLLLEKSAALGRPVRPAGLGARDTLRLEAGMPLYGHELTEEWDSITAGQAWCVDLTKEFIGQAAMQQVQESGPVRRIVGLEIEGRRTARPESPVLRNGRQIGFVTSGTHSPTLDRVIAMAMIESSAAEPGTQLQVGIRDVQAGATVVPLPFYKRQR